MQWLLIAVYLTASGYGTQIVATFDFSSLGEMACNDFKRQMESGAFAGNYHCVALRQTLQGFLRTIDPNQSME